MKALLERLKAMHRLRLEDAMQKRSVGDYGGGKLYDDVLDNICAKLAKIKKDFPEAVKGCALFDMAEHEYWGVYFKRRFHHLFIDRNRVDGSKIVNHDFFNRKDLAIDKLGSDLCYDIGFALGFLMMLDMIHNNFATKKTDISGPEIIAIFQDLNAVATGLDRADNVTRSEMRCGGEMQLSWVLRHKEMQDAFGRVDMVYDFDKSMMMALFSREFKHADCAMAFYDEFCRKKKIPGTDVESLICEFVSALDSYIHTCRDGNARTSVLIGWFLAITHNVTLPVMMSQCRFDPLMVEEGKEWTKMFCAKNDHPSITPKSYTAAHKAKDENFLYLQSHAPELYFVASLFAKIDKDICLSIPFSKEDELFIVSSPIFQMSYKMVDAQGLRVLAPIKQCKPINRRCVRLVCAENPELLQESDLKIRHEKMACLVMEKACQIFAELGEGDFALCDNLISKYTKVDFAESGMKAIFKENEARYLALKAQTKVTPAAMATVTAVASSAKATGLVENEVAVSGDIVVKDGLR